MILIIFNISYLFKIEELLMMKLIRFFIGIVLFSGASLVSALESDLVTANSNGFSDYKEAVTYLSNVVGHKGSFVPNGYTNDEEMMGYRDFQYSYLPTGSEYDFPGTFKLLNHPVVASDAELRTLYYYLNESKDFRVELNYSQNKVYNVDILIRLVPISLGKKIKSSDFDDDLSSYLSANGWSKEMSFFSGYEYTFAKGDVVIKFNKKENSKYKNIYLVTILSKSLASEFTAKSEQRDKDYYAKVVPALEKLHKEAFQQSVRLK